MKRTRIMLLLAFLAGLLLVNIPTAFANIPLVYPTYQTSIKQGYSTRHKALDFSVPFRTEVKAAASGTVYAVYDGCHNVNGCPTTSKPIGKSCSSATCSPNRNFFQRTEEPGKGMTFCNDSGGNVVILSHGNGVYTKYLHLDDSIVVKEGQSVSAGTLLAYSSGTGCSQGYHLHFALCVGGTGSKYGINPVPYFGGGSLPNEPTVTAANESLTETSVYIRGYLDRSWQTNKASSPSNPHIVMLGIANSSTPNINEYYEYLPTVTSLSKFGGTFSSLTPGTTYYYRTMVRLSNGKQIVSPEGSYKTPGVAPPVLVRSVELSSPDPLALAVGQSISLKTYVNPSNASNRGLTWSSSEPSVVSVDQSGLVMSLADGSATITATAVDGSGIFDSIVVIATTPVTGVTLQPEALEIEVGQTGTLIADIVPHNASNRNLQWISSNETVATVDQSGQVLALSAGEASIRVTSQDGSYSATCQVTVKETVPLTIPVTGITVSDPSLSMVVGETVWLYASVTPKDASNPNISFASADPEIVSISPGGVVHAHLPGNTSITISSQDGSGVSVVIPVSVAEQAPSILTITDLSTQRDIISSGEEVMWYAQTVGGVGVVQFNAFIYFGDLLIKESGNLAGEGGAFSIGGILDIPGQYSITVMARDETGNEHAMDGAPVTVLVGLLGDADANGGVNRDDLAEIMDYLVSGAPVRSTTNADYNQDNEVTFSDLLAIMNAIVN